MIVDDTEQPIFYDGAWKAYTQTNPGQDVNMGDFYMATYHETTEEESELSFGWVGTGFKLFGMTGPDHCVFAYAIDGRPWVYIDTYSQTQQVDQVLINLPDLLYSGHEIKVRNRLDVNHTSGRDKFSVDKMEIVGTALVYNEIVGDGTYRGTLDPNDRHKNDWSSSSVSASAVAMTTSTSTDGMANVAMALQTGDVSSAPNVRVNSTAKPRSRAWSEWSKRSGREGE